MRGQCRESKFLRGFPDVRATRFGALQPLDGAMDLENPIRASTRGDPMVIDIRCKGKETQRTAQTQLTDQSVAFMRRSLLIRPIAMVPKRPRQVWLLTEPAWITNLLVGQTNCFEASPHTLLASSEGTEPGVHAHASTAAHEQRIGLREPSGRLLERPIDIIHIHVVVCHQPLVGHRAPGRPNDTTTHDKHLQLLPFPILCLQG
mmetsp:Transcript_112716/g.291269  ORF Transcript_112716/g.291269 Transcript_112716/m.291269 type:complete len:204 (-) Transcript_112716:523-1134(-)